MFWVKALHIIFIVCWFAGVFYLPRLFVYNAMASDIATHQHLNLMQRKLYRFVCPFAVLSITFGLWLTSYNHESLLKAHWFQAKLFLVCLLVAYHLVCGHFVKQFDASISQRDDGQVHYEQVRSHIYFRWFNELPVLVLFGVVILVVVKPF